MFTRLKHQQNLRDIFMQTVVAVRPENIIADTSAYEFCPKIDNKREATIKIQDKSFSLTGKHCHIVGFGKAVLGLGLKLEKELKDFLRSGVLSVPVNAVRQYEELTGRKIKNSILQVHEGALNNLCDEASEKAGKMIYNLARKMTSNDVLIVLASGGGSALLTVPKYPLTLEQKKDIICSLQNKGANIKELNSVRIRLSDVKGGKLAIAARNAHVIITLVVSDIVGNPLHLIASGPTFLCRNKLLNAQEILVKYGIWKSLHAPIQEVIEASEADYVEIAILNAKSEIFLIGDNNLAIKASLNAIKKLNNYSAIALSADIEGDIGEVVRHYIKLLKHIVYFRAGITSEGDFLSESLGEQKYSELLRLLMEEYPVILIFGGELTVQVVGSGIGGRNQELALRMALELYCNEEFYHSSPMLLSAGTDGIDGPTLAAGAFGDKNVIEDFLAADASNTINDIKNCLKNNDTYNFYKNLLNGRYQLITGHTGANVMDLHYMVIP